MNFTDEYNMQNNDWDSFFHQVKEAVKSKHLKNGTYMTRIPQAFTGVDTIVVVCIEEDDFDILDWWPEDDPGDPFDCLF